MSKRIKIVTIVAAVVALLAGGALFLHPDPRCGREPEPDPESARSR